MCYLAPYYDASIGRFTQQDGFGYASPGDPLSLNLYTFCWNNPTMFVDPSGHWPEWLTFNNIFSGVQIIVGAVLIATGAGAGIGVMLVVSGVMGIGMEFVDQRLSQLAGGAGSMANGYGAFRLGMTMAKCTPPHAKIAGGVLMLVGLVTMAFGANEIGEAVTGTNVIKSVTGMSDSAYGWTYLGLNVASGLGQLFKPVCFVAGTLVAAAVGHVAIEEIKAGDWVYAENPETGEKGLKRVVRTFVNEASELVHIKAGGQKITTTPEHPFWVPQKGWTDAVELRAGDMLLLLNGELVVVEQVQHEILESPVTVYNFEVEDFHTYYVSEISVLVHNTCAHGNKWGQERGRYWKGQGEKYTGNAHGQLSGSETYNVTGKNLDRMLKGRAPKGIDGKSVMLHHPEGIGVNFLNYREITRTAHYGNFKGLHPWMFK